MEKPTQSDDQRQRSVLTRKQKILVIDDSADLLILATTILEMDDFETLTAQSGTEALAVLSKNGTPDLILLDMRMEEMSGTEFLAILEEKKPEILKNVPVVFLTAMDQVPKSRAAGFIRKPFDTDTFLEVVHHFVESGTGRARTKH